MRFTVGAPDAVEDAVLLDKQVAIDHLACDVAQQLATRSGTIHFVEQHGVRGRMLGRRWVTASVSSTRRGLVGCGARPDAFGGGCPSSTTRRSEGFEARRRDDDRRFACAWCSAAVLVPRTTSAFRPSLRLQPLGACWFRTSSICERSPRRRSARGRGRSLASAFLPSMLRSPTRPPSLEKVERTALAEVDPSRLPTLDQALHRHQVSSGVAAAAHVVRRAGPSGFSLAT